LTQINRAAVSAREPGDETVRDAGDESIAHEQKEQQFREIEADRTVLSQVREALHRLDEGTFGKCLIDGETMKRNGLMLCQGLPIA
jgi:RNA polymerase-binding transcription factor DksA